MRLNLFLLLVTLICIACDSVVASSRGLVQVKTLDVNSQHERTDGIRRKLREEAVAANVADVEERVSFSLDKLKDVIPDLVSKLKDKLGSVVKLIKRLYQSIVGKFKKSQATPTKTERPLEVRETAVKKSKSLNDETNQRKESVTRSKSI